MTGISISSLISATTPLTGAELVPVVQSGTTAKTTVAALGAAVAYTPAGTGAVTTTVQSKLRETVSVKDFGAVGDGVTDDTAAIQAAINAVIAAGGGTVFFPTGTYLVTSVNVQHGITIEGSGGAIIKRPANTPNYTRTFTTQNTLWGQSYDSNPLVFKNIIINGNRDNQGTYTGYQLEQAHLIFLTGNSSVAGKLRVIIDGCTFYDCVADAISQYVNVDLNVNNCFFSNCFRGGLVITGGYTKLRADNLIFKGTTNARAIDMEMDGAGYGGNLAIQANISNIEVNSHIDISAGNNSSINITNVVYGDISNLSGFNLQSLGNASINISNSNFLFLAGVTNQIRYCENIRFDNCTFNYSNQGTATGGTITLYVFAETVRNLLINNCRFEVVSGSILTDTFYAINFTNGTNLSHKTQISSCYFGSGFDQALYIIGGYLSVSDSYFDCHTALLFSGTSTYPFYGELIDCTVGDNNTYLWNQQGNNTSTSLYVAGEIESADYSTTGIGGTSWYYKSDLTVFGTASNPNTGSVFGNPNDIYKAKNWPIYGSAGTPVIYIGSAVSGPPYFTWVPVNRA